MIQRAPEFWWRSESSGMSLALWPVARVWGAVSTWRMSQPPRHRAAVPVICVGNFTVGGAGKTPAVMALARIARGRGFKPGILATGYGGSAKVPTIVDPNVHLAVDVGDEALLLAAVAPTVVARDRAEGARRLTEIGADVIVMDDGFQNPSLAKDLSLVAVDASVGIGNGRTVPSGPLRAPLTSQLRRAGALLVIGEGHAADILIRAAARAGRPTLRARLKPARIREWRKDPIIAFAGIGHPEKFFATLAETHAPVVRTLGFPDHHAYSEIDAEKLLAIADAEKLRLVTTDKDLVRLTGATGARAKLRERAEPFHVHLEFENPTAIGEMIDEAARKAALAQRA
jgi:tetraacyldisaccharide 4'-kinase